MLSDEEMRNTYTGRKWKMINTFEGLKAKLLYHYSIIDYIPFQARRGKLIYIRFTSLKIAERCQGGEAANDTRLDSMS